MLRCQSLARLPLRPHHSFILASRSLSHSPPGHSPKDTDPTAKPATNGTKPNRPISTVPSRRRAVDIALAGLGIFGITAAFLWRQRVKQNQAAHVPTPAAEASTFTIPVASHQASGAQATKTLNMLSSKETDALLRENEASFAVTRDKNPVYRYDTNHVASNHPIEDDSVCTVIERDPSNLPKGDLLMFGIFDGHSGYHTSKHLSDQLVPFLARELSLLYTSDPTYSSLLKSPLPSQIAFTKTGLSRFWPSPSSSSSKTPSTPAQEQFAARLKLLLTEYGSLTAATQAGALKDVRLVNLDESPELVDEALRRAFVRLDDEICGKPLKQLEEFEKETERLKKDGRPTSLDNTKRLHDLLPALSGSCALMALVDTARNRMHVAVTGDSRAVMGVWEGEGGEGKGKWRARVLTEDQTGRNVKEQQRMQGEHPAEEKDTVVMRGRVLGNLEPTRAMGDARYKWPIGVTERLNASFSANTLVRHPPRNFATPPYVTARPEVAHLDLPTSSPSPSTSSSSTTASPSPSSKSFLVLATDGLWDELSNEEVVALVGNWLSGYRGKLSRQEALDTVLSPEKGGPWTGGDVGSSHTPRRGDEEGFVFRDRNVATHLIRNALGGAHKGRVSALLSIPAPYSRRYRDDITVTVVLMDSEQDAGKARRGGSVQGVVKVDPEWMGEQQEKTIKARL